MDEQRDGVTAPPPPPRPPRRTPRSVVWRRRVVALAVLVAGFAIAWVAVASVGGADKAEPPPPPTTAVAPPKPFRIVFPEGFTRKEMAERVTAVAQIARAQARQARAPEAQQAYLRRDGEAACRGSVRARSARRSRASSFRRRTSSPRGRRRPQLVARPARRRSATNWAKVDLAYARSKNLTPYDVLIIASMVEKETIAPDERQLVAAVIYNRLHGADAARDRRDDSLRARHPRHRVDPRVAAREHNPYNTRNHAGLPPTPIANPGLASMQAAAHPAKVELPLLRAQAGPEAPLLHGQRVRVRRYKAAYGYG